MIHAYHTRKGRLVHEQLVHEQLVHESPSDQESGDSDAETPTVPLAETVAGHVWLDLHDPSPAEREAVQTAFDITLPTPEEMAEIEPSSSFYVDGNAVVMVARVMHLTETSYSETAPVAFLLTSRALITLRTAAHLPFATFPQRARRTPEAVADSREAIFGLIETVVDRVADIIEMADTHVSETAKQIFLPLDPTADKTQTAQPTDYKQQLQSVGRNSHRAAKCVESLTSLSRLVIYLRAHLGYTGQAEPRARVKTLQRDIGSLIESANHLSDRITFILDATLGLINIQQNSIIKIFSVMSVIFLPPTLVASLYGMNFQHMPELSHTYGYPLALALMLVSAIIPYFIFKKKGWL